MTAEAQPQSVRRIAYVPALDGLRGISLPGTIYTHFQIGLGYLPTAPAWIMHSQPFQLNIEMFFVLSGALITSLLVSEFQRTNTIALDKFYVRRSRRLVPALICLVPLLIVVQWIIPSSKDAGFGAGSPLGAPIWVTALTILLFVANWRMASGGNQGWMTPTWTLGIEEQFYLTFPTLLRVVLRRGWSRRQIFAAIWAAIALCLVLVVTVIYPHYGARFGWWATPTQLPPILLGCALGYGLMTHTDGWFVRSLRYRSVAVLGLAGMVLISATQDIHPKRLDEGGYLLYGAFACLLIGHCFAVADQPSIVSRVLSWKPFVVIGQVSYEAYLVHVVVILGVLRAVPHMTVNHQILLDVVLITVISGAFYYFVERPIRRRGWKVLVGQGRPASVKQVEPAPDDPGAAVAGPIGR